jgi:HD-like signal output (HDOD) protein
MSNEKTTSLEQLLASAELPALPQSAIRLLELTQDSANGPAEFAASVETDPALTSQILRLANSSYFGFSREISSVKLAITLIGSQTITNFALWHAVYSLIPDPQCGSFHLKSLWRDSLRRGLFAQTLGKLLGMKNAEDLFVASLLQDMAVPLLVRQLPQAYEELFEARQTGRARLSELEEQRFGWSHAAAAGMVARAWSLPEQLAALIEGHACIDELAGRPAEDPGKLVVGLSALLPSESDPDWTERNQFEAAFAKVRDERWPEPASLLAQIDNEFQQFAPLLKLAAAGRSLIESYRAAQREDLGSSAGCSGGDESSGPSDREKEVSGIGS